LIGAEGIAFALLLSALNGIGNLLTLLWKERNKRVSRKTRLWGERMREKER